MVEIGYLVEIVRRCVDLVGVVQAGRHDPLVARLQHEDPLAPKQHDARQSDHLLRTQRIANDGERLFPDAVRRCQKVWCVDIEIIDVRLRNEALDLDGVVALELDALDLVVLDLDVFALGDLVALDLVGRLNGLAALLVDELPAHTVAAFPVEGAERDAFRSRRRGEERHRTGDEGELEISLPIRPWRHRNSLEH